MRHRLSALSLLFLFVLRGNLFAHAEQATPPDKYRRKSRAEAVHIITQTNAAMVQNQQLRDVAQKNPTDPNAAKALAASNEKTKAAGEAAAQFTNDSQAQSIAANAAAQLGDNKTALTRSGQAVDIAEKQIHAPPNPGDPDDLTPEQKAANLAGALKTRAAVASGMGDKKSAAADVQRALKLFPNDRELSDMSQILLGHSIHDGKNVGIQKTDWINANDVDKINASATKIFAAVGQSIVSNVEQQEAQLTARADANRPHSIEEWVAREREHPTPEKQFLDQSLASRKNGDLASSLKFADMAVNAAPNSGMPLVERAIAYNALHQYNEAVIDLEKAIKVMGWNEASMYLLLAKALNENHLSRNALYDAEAAVNLDPKNAGAYNTRGQTKVALGDDIDGAMADLKKAAELDPHYESSYQDYMHALATRQTQGTDKPTQAAAAGPGSQSVMADVEDLAHHIQPWHLYVISAGLVGVTALILAIFRRREE